eukprot:1071056_1
MAALKGVLQKHWKKFFGMSGVLWAGNKMYGNYNKSRAQQSEAWFKNWGKGLTPVESEAWRLENQMPNLALAFSKNVNYKRREMQGEFIDLDKYEEKANNFRTAPRQKGRL